MSKTKGTKAEWTGQKTGEKIVGNLLYANEHADALIDSFRKLHNVEAINVKLPGVKTVFKVSVFIDEETGESELTIVKFPRDGSHGILIGTMTKGAVYLR